MEETLVVQNVKKTIGKKEIIKGLSFSLKKGEVFGFLGQMAQEKQRRFVCSSD